VPPLPPSALTHEVISAAFQVHNTLGHGFTENIYHEALDRELTHRQIPHQSEPPIPVHYQGEQIATFRPDLLIDNQLLLELKVVETIHKAHLAQCANYLKATGFRVCLLLNFKHPRLEIRRVIV
jgi:GxxExxY protein